MRNKFRISPCARRSMRCASPRSGRPGCDRSSASSSLSLSQPLPSIRASGNSSASCTRRVTPGPCWCERWNATSKRRRLTTRRARETRRCFPMPVPQGVRSHPSRGVTTMTREYTDEEMEAAKEAAQEAAAEAYDDAYRDAYDVAITERMEEVVGEAKEVADEAYREAYDEAIAERREDAETEAKEVAEREAKEAYDEAYRQAFDDARAEA